MELLPYILRPLHGRVNTSRIFVRACRAQFSHCEVRDQVPCKKSYDRLQQRHVRLYGTAITQLLTLSLLVLLFDYLSACMATTASPRQMMYAQIMSQPALLLEVFDATERMVQDAFTHFQPQRWQGIYTAGCGDSFYAGLACEMAFARFCRLPVKALSAMQFARYEADKLPQHAVLFGISNSGQVSRSIEAVGLARAAGVDTIAVTGNGTSGIARAAATAVAVAIPPMGRSPGIRSYTVQLLSLFLCTLRLGELRQVLSAAEAKAWRQQLRDIATCMEATLLATDGLARQVAEHVGAAEDWVFLGSGPSYATALFSAAKCVESCGANAW